ncbi:MAG: chain length determinant protein EpsF [Nitrosomonas sp.]|nr:chain length determinant protein EpsF [Nitrosomonas sp.]
MNLSQFVRIIRVRLKIILLIFFVTILTTLALSLWLPKSYKATATVLLASKGVDPVTGLTMPMQLMHGFMATQVDVISSTRTALTAIDRLKLDRNQSIVQQFEASGTAGDIRHWLAALLLKNLIVEPSRESNVIAISYKGTDPEFVAAMANAFAAAYQEMSIRLTVEPSQQASAYLANQINLLRDQLDMAQRRVSRFQQEEGIVDVDNRLDIETKRLNELSTQLTLAQGEVMGAGQENNRTGAGQSVVNNALINGLKVNLAQAEAKLADAEQRLGKNHPEYEGTRAQVVKLRAELERHTRATSKNAISREAEINAALEAQKTKVLALQQARDELKLLLREAEGAQHAYDSAQQYLNRTSLEGRSNLSGVSILDAANPPVTHDSPKLFLNMLLSVFLGIMLGLGSGLLAEMLDRRVRSTEDLAELLQAPVFGELDLRKRKSLLSLLRFRLPFMRHAHDTVN